MMRYDEIFIYRTINAYDEILVDIERIVRKEQWIRLG